MWCRTTQTHPIICDILYRMNIYIDAIMFKSKWTLWKNEYILVYLLNNNKYNMIKRIIIHNIFHVKCEDHWQFNCLWKYTEKLLLNISGTKTVKTIHSMIEQTLANLKIIIKIGIVKKFRREYCFKFSINNFRFYVKYILMIIFLSEKIF